MQEWERVHARPLFARTVPAEVRDLIREVTQAVGQLIKERPIAGLEALRTVAEWADSTVARAQQVSTTWPRPTRGRRLSR